MSTRSVLVKVLDVLNTLGAPWMLTGSFASNYYGEPRLTHDIDIVWGYLTRWAADLGVASNLVSLRRGSATSA